MTKKAKTNASADVSVDSPSWTPSSHDFRIIALSLCARSLVSRKCAFSVPSLVTSVRVLSQRAATILLNTFISLLNGDIVTNEIVNDQILSQLSDRHFQMTLNWVEALIDSHYSSFAMALSSNNTETGKKYAKLTAVVLHKLFSMTRDSELVLSELESAFGLWTHLSRSARSAVLSSNDIGPGGVPVLGSSLGAIYQVETLKL